MPVSPNAMKLLLLIPLAVTVTYFDMRYRRIPNVLVLAALVSGLVLNASLAGVQGTISSVAGFGLAFIPMFLMHIFGAMGAGDVKLFGAVGAVLGVGLVPMTFVVVADVGRRTRCLFDAQRWNGLFHTAWRGTDLCRHSARVGNASFCNATRPPSHNSLRCSHHGGKFDYGGCLRGMSASVNGIATALDI